MSAPGLPTPPCTSYLTQRLTKCRIYSRPACAVPVAESQEQLQPGGFGVEWERERSNESAKQSSASMYLLRDAANSQLSSIGSSSLKSMPRYASGRQIYQRQQLDYNIISSEPLHPQPKKLPSYAGLNQGNSSYSMRLQLERQLNNKLRTDRLILRQQEDANPERQWVNKIRRAKYLNNVDQVKDLI